MQASLSQQQRGMSSLRQYSKVLGSLITDMRKQGFSHVKIK